MSLTHINSLLASDLHIYQLLCQIECLPANVYAYQLLCQKCVYVWKKGTHAAAGENTTTHNLSHKIKYARQAEQDKESLD